MPAKKNYRFSKKMGTCADRLYALKAKRLAAQKVADEIKEEETALKEHIINTLPKSEASGIAGKMARVTVVNKTVPRVEDWDKFYRHVKRTGNFEMLQRRVGEKAIQERWDNGKEVPGVSHFTFPIISMNKV